ncbi:hypothetical protein BHE97_11620 [Aeromicrobium sp. PE09-221]|uniref:hypothetical protein n=1 Tax=Aeromicrobium sp. PE09-221 TaxID=1898043 RepID=UPI000B3E851B|nr:hypothetical protein [Aeromicrobium sp. PE09-221]OUZ09138.1 hypothetical protein BHE97_11620 [Aeromicrobium sp. PE09-221]
MSSTIRPVPPASLRGASGAVGTVGLVVDPETDSWRLGSVVAELAHAELRPQVIGAEAEAVGIGQSALAETTADQLDALVLLGAPSDENGDPDTGLITLLLDGFARPCAILALREVADSLAIAGIDETAAGVEILDEPAQIVPRLADLLPQRDRWSTRRRGAR